MATDEQAAPEQTDTAEPSLRCPICNQRYTEERNVCLSCGRKPEVIAETLHQILKGVGAAQKALREGNRGFFVASYLEGIYGNAREVLDALEAGQEIGTVRVLKYEGGIEVDAEDGDIGFWLSDGPDGRMYLEEGIILRLSKLGVTVTAPLRLRITVDLLSEPSSEQRVEA